MVAVVPAASALLRHYSLASLIDDLALSAATDRTGVNTFQIAPFKKLFFHNSLLKNTKAPLACLSSMRELLDLAVAHHLFFGRTHWLWGWRTGLPGAACNNLHAALCTAASLEPSAAALAYWQQVSPRFTKLEGLFAAGAEDYFLACRLAETLSPTMPDAIDKRGLDHQRESLFGHPMGITG